MQRNGHPRDASNFWLVINGMMLAPRDTTRVAADFTNTRRRTQRSSLQNKIAGGVD